MAGQFTSDLLNICSFNCEGVNRTVDYMKEFLSNNLCDILCLQETWLIEQNLLRLANIHSDYLYTGKSGVDSNSDILVGRPKGGVAILYKKSVAKCIKCVDISSDEINIYIYISLLACTSSEYHPR